MELWVFMKERKKILDPSDHHGAFTSGNPDCPDPGISGCSVHLHAVIISAVY
jgi:hypothetical protein